MYRFGNHRTPGYILLISGKTEIWEQGNIMNSLRTLATLFLCAVAIASVGATEVTIPATLDVSYFDVGPDNNMGVHTHVAVGTANNDRTNRALFYFDIASMVPSGSTINSVTFEFEVTQQGGASGMAGDDFNLHAMITTWTEGTGDTNIGGITGDGATWNTSNGVDAWITLGGDFAATVSGSVFVDGANNYSISSPQLVSDVQAIVDGSATNFGFMLKGANDIFGSAARVTSREGGNPARLVIDFSSGGVLLGDVNLDGVVSLLDVAPFVNLITTGTFQAEGDINQDGVVSLLDVAPFVALLTGG